MVSEGDSIDVGLMNQDPPPGRPSNLDSDEYVTLGDFGVRREGWIISGPDKGPGTILSSTIAMWARACAHALSPSYERALLLVERLGHDSNCSPKTFPHQGAPGAF